MVPEGQQIRASKLPPHIPTVSGGKGAEEHHSDAPHIPPREPVSLLSARQFGFRKARSAAALTLILSNQWSDALDQGRPPAFLAVDIAGAFDRVWHAVSWRDAVGVGGALLEL